MFDFINSTSTTSTVDFGKMRDDESFRTNLVGTDGAGRIGKERFGCIGMKHGPRSRKAVAKLLFPLQFNLLELSAIIIRGSGMQWQIAQRKRNID